MTFGLAVRRGLYKHDDRVDGTTINDGGQTKIDLFGLDPEETRIFFLDQYQGGLDLKISDKTTTRFSIARETVEFNFNREDDLPGQNIKAEHYSFYTLSGGILMKASRFILNIGANFSLKEDKFDRQNESHVEYKSQSRDLYAMISTGI